MTRNGSAPTPWPLTVVDAFDIAPRMRRVVLTGSTLGMLDYRPGQALVLEIPLEGGGIGNRDYTIRSLDRARPALAIDVLLHADTPGPRWARSVRPGDAILAWGPRGRIHVNADAHWHVLSGDETCIPAIFHILEVLPPGTRAQVFIEIADLSDRMPVQCEADIRIDWLVRSGTTARPLSRLAGRLATLPLPPGRAQFYVIGETSCVRARRRGLIDRGVPPGTISAEGYWRPNRIGGHDHVED